MCDCRPRQGCRSCASWPRRHAAAGLGAAKRAGPQVAVWRRARPDWVRHLPQSHSLSHSLSHSVCDTYSICDTWAVWNRVQLKKLRVRGTAGVRDRAAATWHALTLGEVPSIMVASLLPADGSRPTHCVGISGRRVFDTCESGALPLTQATLDRCAGRRCVGFAQVWALALS